MATRKQPTTIHDILALPRSLRNKINSMTNWQNTQWMRAGCPVTKHSINKYAKLVRV